ncbi:glycosyltransferase family protein [Polynucleobacter sp. MG-5-Ahmo-C2]|uniref:tetratricopeptide repeat-containing glycosyltransferase family protein n=1 Tax=Polynucleobacter sp. MG-5-Ahmo-C2 TaxID=2081051 RepID=UPI001BFDC29F|nr:tetratricopeptide repeat-containing glycosyltransferase family protein [Polynucleobacter sp. MG-5-Ahmo-C2]QWD98260.1 glycosyltransferase family protein [Polynucleobacter sp. MG-5-Ahmo-C2]
MNPQVGFLLNKALDALRNLNVDSAALYLNQAIKFNPKDPHILRLLGVVAIKKGQHKQAIDYLNTSLRVLPKNPLTKCNLGSALFELKQYESALEAFDQSIKLDPKYDEAWLNKGNILFELKRFVEALTHYEHAASLKPNYADAWSNRGNALRMLDRHEEAINSYHQALILNPNDHITWNNKGFALNQLRYFDEALADYDKAIGLNPGHYEAFLNKSLTLLLQGDFERGLPLYESRWSSDSVSKVIGNRRFDKPCWAGTESLKDKSILLYGEQGLGDFIQFCRYAKLVSELGARVILEVPDPLVTLLSDLDGVSQLVIKEQELPSFDFQCPLLSLPLAFKTNLSNIPSAQKYLSGNFAAVTEWEARLGQKTKPRIGLVWSGNPDHKNDYNRSLALKDLLPYLPEHYEYISLQKEVREADQLTLELNTRIRNFSQYLKSFGDSAALIECLDLVISVDTSVAHLSGALGKKTWVLLPFVPDWRWLLDRSDTPWYPSISLYRQEKIGDWAGVLEKIQIDVGLL